MMSIVNENITMMKGIKLRMDVLLSQASLDDFTEFDNLNTELNIIRDAIKRQLQVVQDSFI